ncbi:MAG: hypothetical protein KatS3mg035_0722 [Bacteroidia bacterium]|nr:MAG: hypothetical protein KatS3mg035_0722 [Bacteroidia bacterium]
MKASTLALINEVEKLIYAHASRNDATAMAAYMKNLFPFAGIKKPKREIILKEHNKQLLNCSEELPQIAEYFWNKPEREFQYIALKLLEKSAKKLRTEDIKWIEKLIVSKSWWDTVDALAANVAGTLLLKDDKAMVYYSNKWNASDNMWLNRTAILIHLSYKQKTNTIILASTIEKHIHSNEFFIKKAIGWVLRQYSKTNPEWVKQFVKSHPNLKPLSVREATKYI